jgi:hypothetical protein
VFGPKRTVNDRFGQTWELYLSRSAPPPDPRLPQPQYQKIFSPFEFGCLGILFAPFLLFWYLVAKLVVFPIMRLLRLEVKGRRQRVVQIEAISWHPSEQRRRWITTPLERDRVLDEVAEALKEGKIAEPDGATYLGNW